MFKFWVAAHCPKTKKAKPVTVGADVTVNESFLGQICTVQYVPCHLFQPRQAWFLCGYPGYFWDSVCSNRSSLS